MFRTHSPYSPFFTSGLLSAADRPHSPDVPLSPRRGSLPTSTSTSTDSAIYFTLQPRQNDDALRSFLSLDLAESQSMRSASLKRKTSTPAKAFRFPPIAEAPKPSASLRTRFSRDSLRTIPSPKPAPSIMLPDLPRTATSPPRLPSLQLAPIDLSITLQTTPPRTQQPRLRISVAPAPAPTRRPLSVATTSTRARTHNRSAALARLEGRDRPRVHPPRSAPSPAPSRNFMSMSDDEDEDDGDADDDLSELDLDDPRAEPEDVVVPAPYLAVPPPLPLPLPVRTKRPSPTQDAPVRRTRTRTGRPPASAGPAAEWFPLRSFIDLDADGAAGRARDSRKTASAGSSVAPAWKWRSFIHVANVV